jgi:phosphonate transport system permease protein
VLLAAAVAGLAAALYLGLAPSGLVPGGGGLALAGRFFAGALSPALSHQADFVPAGTPPLLLTVLEAAGHTVLFAAAAMGLALVVGAILGFLASTAWWAGEGPGSTRGFGNRARRAVGPLAYGVSRVLLAALRSVHELLWAVLFLAAFGLDPATGVLALALPYGGTLAKVFSEMIDEAPRDAAHALRGSGAGALQAFAFGLLPRAAPDLAAYAFYRFECAVRSSAVLGFFGYPTLGLFVRQSFLAGNYGETWTFLYALFALVFLFEWWSGALRLRAVA